MSKHLQFPRRYLRRYFEKSEAIKKRISLQTRRLLGHLTLSSGSYLPNQWRQHSEVSDRDYYMPTIPEAIFLDDPVPSVFALGYGPWSHIQIRSEFLGFVTRLRGRWTLGLGYRVAN